MEIKLSIHLHHSGKVELDMPPPVMQILNTILLGIKHIMSTQAEAATQLASLKTALDAKLDKISAETTGLVVALRDAQSALQDAIASGSAVSPELQAVIDSFGEIVTKAESIDAQVDDAAPNPTPTPPADGDTGTTGDQP